MIGAKLAEKVPAVAPKALPYAGNSAFAKTVEVSPRAFASTRPPVSTTMPGGFQGPACYGVEKEAWISAKLQASGPAKLAAEKQGLNVFDEVVAPIFDKADELFGKDYLP
jgi:hypothetical protein